MTPDEYKAPRLASVLAEIGRLLPDDVAFSIGGQEKQGAPPRIVLDPQRFTFTHSRGGKETLWTRLETVRAHVWGKTMDDVEDLTEILLNAVRKVTAAAAEPTDGEWNAGAVNDRGAEADFDLVFMIPVLRRAGRARFLPLDPMEMDVVPPEAAG